METYTVVSGDFCFEIYTNFGLTSAQFQTINPSNCDLPIGQVLCFASASTCGETYTAISGDFLLKDWGEYSITIAQLEALNPSFDQNCDIDVGQVLCVG